MRKNIEINIAGYDGMTPEGQQQTLLGNLLAYRVEEMGQDFKYTTDIEDCLKFVDLTFDSLIEIVCKEAQEIERIQEIAILYLFEEFDKKLEQVLVLFESNADFNREVSREIGNIFPEIKEEGDSRDFDEFGNNIWGEFGLKMIQELLVGVIILGLKTEDKEKKDYISLYLKVLMRSLKP